MLPANVGHKDKTRTVNGSLLHDKEGILYKEPEGFQATEFPNGNPETPTQRLAQTTSHVNRYVMQLDELYRTLLESSLRSADAQVAGRFNGLLSELYLLTGVNKSRVESLMKEEISQGGGLNNDHHPEASNKGATE
ncbi:hypothetical protein [Serratia liquefaciens]|jgi:hypothetical protein|uniref:hypothetical protein n=1 Tax=Serratia liquefaciens TaxID=614 RepID=UPI000E0391BF|nr:hypothetical protein [Serratia liquefaciens]CAI1097241.1 Uncharacterised protein [Serratia liquefaciens]SUI44024.1 Uncharacterised protein [Serratia liquefaciens]